MKRVLLDHCVPQKVRLALPEGQASTARHFGWSELRNGELLRVAEESGFDVFTSDKNLRYQQNLTGRKLSIVVLPTNQLPVLLPHFSSIAAAVSRASPGSFEEMTLE